MAVQLAPLLLEYSILNCVTFAGLSHDATTTGPTPLANEKFDNVPAGSVWEKAVVVETDTPSSKLFGVTLK